MSNEKNIPKISKCNHILFIFIKIRSLYRHIGQKSIESEFLAMPISQFSGSGNWKNVLALPLLFECDNSPINYTHQQIGK